MPLHNKILLPRPGELWTNTLVGVDGLVVGHQGTVVTLASLTGVRAPVEFNRSYNPWQKKQDPPINTPTCSTVGCEALAVVWYRRPMQDLPEVVCPRHVPRGAQSDLLSDGQTFACAERLGQRCLKCPEEAVEVIGEIENSVRDTWMWMCPHCGVWWIRAVRDDWAIHHRSVTDVALAATPPGYTFKEVLRVSPDPLRATHTLYIHVLPKPTTVITGPKEMTLFDYLIREGD